MLKKIVNIALLVTLPMVAIQADKNVSDDPFFDDSIFKDFQQFREEMNGVLDNFHKKFFDDKKMLTPMNIDNGFTLSMKTDINDKGDYYEVKADLPGVDKQRIDVNVKNNILSIDAKSEQKKEEKKDDKIIRQERFVGAFHRSMSLPNDANGDKMTTEYKDGVLTVKIPKKK